MRQINLLPERVARTEYYRQIRRSLMMTVLPAMVVMIAVHLTLSFRIVHLQESLHQPREAVDIPEVENLSKKYLQLQTNIRHTLEQAEPLAAGLQQNVFAEYVLQALAAATRKKVWLTRIDLSFGERAAVVEGRAFNPRLVSEFMLELKQVPLLNRVELESMDRADTPAGDEVVFRIFFYMT